MAYLLAKKATFLADWAAVGKRCVVNPRCCVEPLTGNLCGVPVTLAETIYVTVTGLPPACTLSAFPNVFELPGEIQAKGSALTNGESYQLSVVFPVFLGAALPTYTYADETDSANLVPGGNPFTDYGLKVGSTTRDIDGTLFGIDIYLQIKLFLSCPFGPSVCDNPIPNPVGLTWPIYLEVISYCVATSPVGAGLPFFNVLLSEPEPNGSSCSPIGCFDSGNPLPVTLTTTTCCTGAEFEVTF